MLRYILILSLLAMSAVPTRADVPLYYMEMECDPQAGVFKLRDVLHYDVAPRSADPKVKLINKLGGVTYERSTDDYLIPSRNTSVLGECKLIRGGRPWTFTVRQGRIDSGNVQRMCGAANSAAVRLFVNDTVVAYYPSAKEMCLGRRQDEHQPRVEFSKGRLEICQTQTILPYRIGQSELQQRAEICRSGALKAHAERYIFTEEQISQRSKGKKNETGFEALTDTAINEQLAIYRVENYEQNKRIKALETKETAQTARISQLDANLSKESQDLDAAKLENEALKKERKAEQSKSFGKKFKDLFRHK